MTLETNFHEVNNESKIISDDLGCGRGTYPTLDGSFHISFSDEDKYGFSWELVLILRSDDPSIPFMESASVSLYEAALIVESDGKPIPHSFSTDTNDINSFADVHALVKGVMALKPPVSIAKKAAVAAAEAKKTADEELDKMKKKLGGMGINV